MKFLLNKGLGKIPYLFKIWQHYFKLIHPEYVNVRDFKLTTEVPIFYILPSFYYGFYGGKQFEYFSNSIKQGDIVFDLGAHIGYFTLEASKKAKKIYSFEPNLISFNILKKNIQLNNLKNVIIENKAVYDKDSSTNFHESGVSSKIDSYGSKIIKTITLDSYTKQNNIKSIDILKVDVEDSECEVIMGARKIIKESPTIKIFMEITLKDDEIPSKILDFINEENFSLKILEYQSAKSSNVSRIEVIFERLMQNKKEKMKNNIGLLKGAVNTMESPSLNIRKE